MRQCHEYLPICICIPTLYVYISIPRIGKRFHQKSSHNSFMRLRIREIFFSMCPTQRRDENVIRNAHYKVLLNTKALDIKTTTTDKV